MLLNISLSKNYTPKTIFATLITHYSHYPLNALNTIGHPIPAFLPGSLDSIHLEMTRTKLYLQAHLILLCFSIVLHRGCFLFYKLKARPSTCKKITTGFIGMVWKGTCNISEVCLYLNPTFEAWHAAFPSSLLSLGHLI